jgi:signal transduction histidine kinase
MTLRGWLQPSRQATLVFAAVAALSTTGLGVLAWQLIQQEQMLDGARLRGIVENAADDVIRRMADVSDRRMGPAPHAIVRITRDQNVPQIDGALPFVPARQSLPEADPSRLAAASEMEVRRRDLTSAHAMYEDLASAPDGAVRAAALVRLGALDRQRGEFDAAIERYTLLEKLDAVSVAGLPAGLLGATGKARALQQAGRVSDVREAAAALARDLNRGRWSLLESEYDSFMADAAEWTGGGSLVDREAAARAQAASWLWSARAQLPPAGRQFVSRHGVGAVVTWDMSGAAIEATVQSLGPVVTASMPEHFVASIRDSAGHTLFDGGLGQGEAAKRFIPSSDSSWTVSVSADSRNPPPAGSSRQTLLFVVAVLGVVLLAGWYFSARLLARERGVARLQNDFVASVSHEFRSPLTSLTHVADLLATDRLEGEAQKRQAYTVLTADTARLRDMVENLLDFSEREHGSGLRMERTDVGRLVARLVQHARTRVAPAGYTIDFSPPDEELPADVDPDALSRAIWNLIDNAVKYSPDSRTIWVSVRRHEGRILIEVRDQGMGIPTEEQTGIFNRFVRGEESRRRRIRGTGIGLALVKDIVEAHGGRVDVASRPGAGSSFIVTLRSVDSVA